MTVDRMEAGVLPVSATRRWAWSRSTVRVAFWMEQRAAGGTWFVDPAGARITIANGYILECTKNAAKELAGLFHHLARVRASGLTAPAQDPSTLSTVLTEEFIAFAQWSAPPLTQSELAALTLALEDDDD